LGSVAANGFAQPFSRMLAPQTEILIAASAGESVPALHLFEYSLQQRPPPAFPLD